MKCDQVQERLLHSIDKKLSPRIRDHLLGCEECERKYRILQETAEIARRFWPCCSRRFYLDGGTAISAGSTLFFLARNMQ